MRELIHHLAISPTLAAATVITTAVIYGVLVLVLSTLGQRLYATPSNMEIAAVAILGSIVGRTTLGPFPTLSTGIIALVTLFALELSVGAIRGNERVQKPAQHRAVAAMINGQVKRDVLKRFHMTEVTLWAELRAKGISDPNDVAVVIVESSGRMSVLTKAKPLHPASLTGVRDSGEILSALGISKSDKTPKTGKTPAVAPPTTGSLSAVRSTATPKGSDAA